MRDRPPIRPAVPSVAALLLVAAAAALALSGLPDGARPAAAQGKGPIKGDPVRGKSVYTRNCMVCHMPDGTGGKKLTAEGNPSRNFTDPAFWAARTDDQLREVVNKGVAKSGMIPWKGILKPQEIEDVLAYEKTFAKKAEAPAVRPQAAEAPPGKP